MVGDLLFFLCKEYNLIIDFIGNILVIKIYEKFIENLVVKIIDVIYYFDNNLFFFDLKEDKLYDVFKKIMDKSGKNLVFVSGLEN